ncbi:MAG: hypothetical protein AVDCRST_MAG56-3672 [uncultured Cytophagales bacterium]|uniref:Acyltransferase 3 domain-containing protein n=1 Tax=uncultured Cytophagales bacterium TaxID=158755 RepID=A0A6J4JKE3_9SPHI|nr:MAG: hypothetical protein AVDCRST_MAG56-3672 [uncultured Cytophagales bacterium]
MPPTATARIHFLDSIRGLAATTVFLSHLAGGYPLAVLESVGDTPLRILWHGEGAVSLFFVLSGLVLSLQFFKQESFPGSFSIVRYGIARLFRIMPLFWAVVWLSYAGYLYCFNPAPASLPASDWLKGFWGEEKTFGSTLLECLLVLKIPLQAHHRLVPQDWTLAVELVQSVALPFLVMLARYRLGWMVFFVVFGAKLLGLPVFTFSFMLGVVLARYAGTIGNRWGGLPLAAKVLTLAAAVLLYGNAFLLPEPFTRVAGKFLIDLTALGSGLFLVMGLGSNTLQALLNRRPLLFIGKVSYGIYLTHMLLLLCLTPYALRFLNTLGVYDPYLLFAGGAAVTFAATVLLSFVTYHAVERPGIRLGKWFLDWATLLFGSRPLREPEARHVRA